MIAGPTGTPYAGGLFEFDCFIPLEYPHKPPLMHLRTPQSRALPLVLTAAKRDILICTEQRVAEPVRTRHRSTFGPVAGGVRSLEAGDGTEGEITRAAVCAYPEHTISTALSRGPDDRPLS